VESGHSGGYGRHTEVAMAVEETPVTAAAPAEPRLADMMRQLIQGAFVLQAISVSARLGVADVLADGPRPVAEIAQRVGAHGSALYRVLRALGDVGVVAELENRHFALTPLGEMLRSDVPGSLREWVTLLGMPFSVTRVPGCTRLSRLGNRRLTGFTALVFSSTLRSTPRLGWSLMRP
jgi:hypothetical protein